MRTIDALVFDCDGVLVDSEVRLVEIDQRMLADLGWPLTQQEIHDRFVGRTGEYFATEVARRVGPLAEDWREPYQPMYDRALHEELEAIRGVEHVIRSLTVPFAVASNSSHRRVVESLELVGLRRYFGDRIVGSDDVPQGKPAPDVYLRAAEILGADPTACVAIEDSATGVRAARAAGMRVLGYVDGLTSAPALRAAGATTFADMSDLPGVLVGLGTDGWNAC